MSRLQNFMDRENLRPGNLAREAGYSRQHLLRLRRGTMEPTRTSMLALAGACSRLLGRTVRAEELFDLDPSSEVRTVLLVEDDAFVAESVGALLELDGWTVLHADNASGAIAAACNDPPTLALIDVGLGSEDGRQLGFRLRELRPALPLLFMSGHLFAGTELGPIGNEPRTGFLSKPFGPEALCDAIERILLPGPS